MICDTFKNLAHATWNKIDDSKRVDYQLKEETFTDINLLELKLQHPAEIITYEFNKRQEGQNGADWEWWFTDGTKWVGFRVQAKIINIYSDEFEHLHYQNGTSAPQSEKLILQAEDKGVMPRTPVYCLFMSTEKLDETTITAPLKTFGCSLMSAYRVRGLRTGKIRHVSKLQPYLVPWHELVCHRADVSLIDHVKAFSKKHFTSFTKLKHTVNEEITQPPDYVLRVYRATGDNLNFEDSPLSLAGLMIVTSQSQ